MDIEFGGAESKEENGVDKEKRTQNSSYTGLFSLPYIWDTPQVPVDLAAALAATWP